MQLRKGLMAGVLSLALVATSIVPASAADSSYDRYWMNHGTDRTTQYTEDMVNNTPPEDYKIPEGMVRDAKDGEYSRFFLKDTIQTVKIEMDEANLNYMLQHGGDKEQVMTKKVTIGDASAGYAGIKTKGNFTLTNAYNSSSDRFSFRLNFGKYIKKKQYGAKQNFYGVDKICFNNLFFDTTALKEYTALRILTEMGVPTMEFGVARLYINDKFYGVYSMIEDMDKPMIERNLNLNSKEVSDYLTKPEQTRLIYNNALDAYKEADGSFTLDSMKDILYKNENGEYEADARVLDENLWEGKSDDLQDVAEMLPTVLKWEERLNLLSNGKDFSGEKIDVNSEEYVKLLDQVVDTDRLLRYFASHSFLVQTDYMFSDDSKNFALYVGTDGRAMILPWDYDLSWGGFKGATMAQQVANLDLDNMTTDLWTDLESFYENYPIFHVLYQNKSLKEKFHTYMEDCAKIAELGGVTSDGRYFEAGGTTKAIDGLADQIQTAMGEKLADNVYYLNNIRQPGASAAGIPNLRKIVAMRSLGVWLQTTGKSDYMATGYGCNIQALGNGMNGGAMTKGKLGVIDPATGIFALGNFTESGGLWMKGGRLSAGDDSYDKVAKKLKGSYTVYGYDDMKASIEGYQLYIPVSKEKTNVKIYSYNPDTDALTELAASVDEDNRHVVKTDDLRCIVAAEAGTTVISTQEEVDNTKTKVKKTIITASDLVKNASNKKQSFKLGAKTNYGTMTYTSSNKKVKVSSKGKVTLPAKFSGTVKITVTVKAGSDFSAASKKVKITVPAAVKLKNIKKISKNSVKVVWKKSSGTTGYKVEYSTSKKFKKASSVKAKKSSAQNVVLSKLKKKTYYVRVRAYIVSGGKTYQSLWSNTKKIKL